jgi:hypothetical protein
MFKMGLHDPFRHFKHKLWPKEGLWVKLTIWLLTTKSQESPRFPCMQMVCHIPLESSQQGLQKNLDFISIVGLHTKLWAPKVTRVPTLGILGLPLGSFGLRVLGQNDIWVLVPWLGIEYTIKGKVVASPKFGLWWILWIHGCPWLVHASKCSNYALTNLLLSLCKSLWVNELLVNLLSPIPELQHAPLPRKCYEPKNVPQLFFLLLSSFWTRSWVYQGAWGCVI